MTPFAHAARLAARQHHVISLAQLYALELSEAQIRWLVKTRRLFRLHRGVFAVGRAGVSREGGWLAAVLAGPGRAALGHRSAAVHRRLLEFEGPEPELIVPDGASHRGTRGIIVHTSSDITEADIEVVDAIRVTTVLRTLIDLSRSRISAAALSGAVRQASRVHRADLRQLRGYRRIGPIVALLDPLVELTESDFEAIFLGVCVEHGLPRPQPQERRGRRRVDFLFAQERLIVECDSRGWHDNDVSFLDDRRKDRDLRARGYDVMRFTWAEVIHEPAGVAAEISAALCRRQRELRVQFPSR